MINLCEHLYEILMLNKLNQILNRPFPIVESSQEKIFTSLFFGGFVFMFLLIFEPFGMDQVDANKVLYNLGYGFITASIILLHGFVTMKIFSNFFAPGNWVVWKSVIHNSIIILPIALLNWIYFQNVYKPEDVSYSFITFVFITIGVGILPSPILILYFERRLNSKNKLLSEKVIQKLSLSKIAKENNAEIEFVSDAIKIPIEDFLCIKSMGNYIVVYFQKNGRQQKEVIRGTMKNFAEVFSNNSNIIRCHRSYIANLNRVKGTSGNARSMYLHLETLDFEIPVSRNFSKNLISEIL